MEKGGITMKKGWAYPLCLVVFFPPCLAGWISHPSPGMQRTYRDRTARWWEQECRQWEVIEEYHGDCWWGEPYTKWGRQPTLRVGAKLPLLAGDPAAVPVLVELLHSPYAKVRRIAVEGLGQIGPPVRASIRALNAVADDPDCNVRWWLMVALPRVDTRGPDKGGPQWDRYGNLIRRDR
jgi:hypothetical protein